VEHNLTPPFGDACKARQTHVVFKYSSPEAYEIVLGSPPTRLYLSQGVRVHANSTLMFETFKIQLHLLFRRVTVEATNLLTGLSQVYREEKMVFKPPYRSSTSATS